MTSRKQQTLPFAAATASKSKSHRKASTASDSKDSDVPQLDFRFIDLFAGIGGLRIGLEKAGWHCVFSSEIDPYAQKTYTAWFG